MRETSIQQQHAKDRRSVTVIVTNAEHSSFLADALESCLRQTIPPAEILIFCSAANHKVDSIATSFADVKVYHQGNEDQDDPQTHPLARVPSEFFILLDANDRLTPIAVEAGLACFRANPASYFVYGAHRLIDQKGNPLSPVWRERLDLRPLLNPDAEIGPLSIRSAAMYRTSKVSSITDQQVEFVNLCTTGTAANCISEHSHCVTEYRAIRSIPLARFSAEKQPDRGETHSLTHFEEQPDSNYLRSAPHEFALAAKEIIANGWSWKSIRVMARTALLSPLPLAKKLLSKLIPRIIRLIPRPLGLLLTQKLWSPAIGKIRFGDFARTTPISTDFGFDRGEPIDRYYIERALESHAELLRGRVLEVKDRRYTTLYGHDKVISSDVLDIDPLNPLATVIGDLGIVGALPKHAFDCIILTQTLQYIYHLDNAIENLYQALAPGGILLITVPAISPVVRGETGIPYWAFTPLSLNTMLSRRFEGSNVAVESFGNVFAAICFLTGLSLTEVEPRKLDYKDEMYPVIVFARVTKPM